MNQFISLIDPFFIAPYRWFDHPLTGWWVGTFILAFWSALLGELTLAAGWRLNRFRLEEKTGETMDYHRLSLAALKSGDKNAYRDINKLANESFGQTFFLSAALGMSTLWPAFLAAAWLQVRFGHIRFSLPILGAEVGFVPGFLLCYLLARLLLAEIKKNLPAFKETVRPWP